MKFSKLFTAAALVLLSACAHAPGKTAGSERVINWGDDFTQFWIKAHGLPFSEQVALWDQLIEAPHRTFYQAVVWRDTQSADFKERKLKRLKAVFDGYSRKHAEIQSNFKNFESTLNTQISRFRSTFPSAHFTLPIMAVVAPTFNGKTDSYEDNGHQHFLAFGVDTLTLREDSPDVLYSHELFHAYHGEASGTKDDGASEDSTLIDSLWAEGLATFVSHELNPSASMKAVFMDADLPGVPEDRLSFLAAEFLKVSEEKVHSKVRPEIYGNWFLLNKCPKLIAPCRSGYFLGYHVARVLRQQNTLDEMAHWPFKIAQQKIHIVLESFAHAKGRPEAQPSLTLARPTFFRKVKEFGLVRERIKDIEPPKSPEVTQ